MFRKLYRVRDKIGEVGRLLHANGLDAFVRCDEELGRAIKSRFPSLSVGSLAEDIKKSLFWPRNRVLHAGFTGYGYEDAARCFSIAHIGLAILRKMDLARRSSS